MKRLLLACAGSTVGSLALPAFQVRTGDLVCLHLPCPASSPADEAVSAALTGQRPQAGLSLFGRVRLVTPPCNPGGLIGLFYRPRTLNWLRRAAGLATAQAIVVRQGLDPTGRIGELSWQARILLGVEAAWARQADAIVFQTVGLGPSGREAVFAAVAARLLDCPAIHLSYPYWTQGRQERQCFHRATCLELRYSTDNRQPQQLPLR